MTDTAASPSLPRGGTKTSEPGKVTVGDSPRSNKTTAVKSAVDDRPINANEMDDEVIQVPLSTFENSYLPAKPLDFDDIVQQSLADLESEGLIVRTANGELRFTDYQIAPHDQRTAESTEQPAKHSRELKPKKRVETDIFKNMVKLWNGIKNETDPRRNSSLLTYYDKPYDTTASETSGGSYRPDALLGRAHAKSTRRKKKIDTHGVAVALLYKPDENPKDRVKNATQALTAATFTMNEDPTRNWTYSITIDNTQVRIWFWSRSHTAVSEPFNFVTDVEQFVKIMARFMFADSVQLGYNPHIRRLFDKKQMMYYYVYKVGDEFYKTVGSIYEQRSLCISSRATRVWKVQRTVSEEDMATHPLYPETLVLRDVWLQRHADTEMQTQIKIFADIDEFAADIAKKTNAEVPQFEGIKSDDIDFFRDLLKDHKYKKYFLTITAEHSEEDVGSLSKPCAKGDGCLQIRGLFFPPDSDIKNADRMTTNDGKTRAKSHETASNQRKVVEPVTGPITRPYEQKKRSMSLCKEVCEPLHDLRDMSTFLQVTLQCLFAAILMWFAGWIHRDISTGNILAFKQIGKKVQGKLSDLEYARKLKRTRISGPSSDPKTGTAYFMAIEIHSGRRITLARIPKTRVTRAPAGGHFATLDEDEQPVVFEKVDAVLLLPENKEHVRHAFIHDMESFFWIVLWAFTGFVVDRKIRDWANTIFVNSSICPEARHKVFLHSRALHNALEENMPKAFKEVGVADELEVARQDFMSIYTGFVSPDESDTSRLGGDCQAFHAVANLLRACKGAARILGDKIVLSLADPITPISGTATKDQQQQERQTLSNVTGKKKRQAELDPDGPSDTERPSKALRSEGQKDVASREAIWRDRRST